MLVAAGERVLDVQPGLAARVRADGHAAVLKIWAKRHRDLSRARNRAPQWPPP
jgi:hypothetical protein